MENYSQHWSNELDRNIWVEKDSKPEKIPNILKNSLRRRQNIFCCLILYDFFEFFKKIVGFLCNEISKLFETIGRMACFALGIFLKKFLMSYLAYFGRFAEDP